MHVILEAGDSSQLRAFYAFVRMQTAMTRGSKRGSWGRARMKQGKGEEGTIGWRVQPKGEDTGKVGRGEQIDGPVCGGEMLCYQEATYKIIRHRRDATPTTLYIRQSAPSAFKSQPRLHCRLALLFFHRGRSVAGPEHVCPAGCANIRNRNMNIPPVGAVSFVIILPLLALFSPLTPLLLRGLYTCVVHACTYLPVYANRPFPFLLFLWRAL